MTKRDKNVRKACDEIHELMNHYLFKNLSFNEMFKEIDIRLHRIKRTTWRGEKKQVKKIKTKRPTYLEVIVNHSTNHPITTDW